MASRNYYIVNCKPVALAGKDILIQCDAAPRLTVTAADTAAKPAQLDPFRDGNGRQDYKSSKLDSESDVTQTNVSLY